MEKFDLRSDIIRELEVRGRKVNARANPARFECEHHSKGNLNAWIGDDAVGCFACSTKPRALEAFAKDLGITVDTRTGLTIEEYAERKHFSVAKLMSWGVRTETGRFNDDVVAIPYRDAAGKLLRTKHRVRAGKTFWQNDGMGTHLYGLDMLAKYPSHPVILVEGESDCHAAWHHAFLAVGVPGSKGWKSEWAALLAERDVYVWQELDEAASDMVKRIGSDLPNAKLLANGGVKDLADLHVALGKGFVEALTDRMATAVGINEAPTTTTAAEIATDELPTSDALTLQQVAGAQALLARNLNDAPRWAFVDLDKLVGPMLPGDLVAVGSLMGNGKSTLLMTQMDHFAQRGTPVLYFPLEVDPEVNRLRWAAWKLNLDVSAVIRQEWSRLGEGAEEAVRCVLEDQGANKLINFATPKRITVQSLRKWCMWAQREFGCRVAMIDHLHRMEFGGSAAGHRMAITDGMREVKDLGRELGMVIIASAQLNRSSEPLDAYTAPQMARLKETAAIGEEADVVLMLSRKLKRDLPKGWALSLKVGTLTENDLAEPNTMVVTCRKHRLDASAFNQNVLLAVQNGRLVNRAREYQLRSAPARIDTREAQAGEGREDISFDFGLPPMGTEQRR